MRSLLDGATHLEAHDPSTLETLEETTQKSSRRTSPGHWAAASNPLDASTD